MKESSEWSIERFFDELRKNPKHHLGIGDIRLTLSQQEELCDIIAKFYTKKNGR